MRNEMQGNDDVTDIIKENLIMLDKASVLLSFNVQSRTGTTAEYDTS